MIVGTVHHCKTNRPLAASHPLDTVWSCDFCSKLWVVVRRNEGWTVDEMAEADQLQRDLYSWFRTGEKDEHQYRWWKRAAAREYNARLRQEKQDAYETRKAAINAAVAERNSEHVWRKLDPQDRPVEPIEAGPLRGV